MKVINLYGGAGAGKSTLASALFYRLRMDNQINCELVPEFAKDVVYEGGRRNLSDQFYLLGNQQHRLWRLKQEGVQLAICDSPIDMCIAYCKVRDFPHLPELITLVRHMKSQYTEFNVFVHREQAGQFRKNKHWSVVIDREILTNITMDLSVKFSEEGADKLYKVVREWLDGRVAQLGEQSPCKG